jgi:hypothetical protein
VKIFDAGGDLREGQATGEGGCAGIHALKHDAIDLRESKHRA